MGDWHSGEVAANGVRIHYTRTGGSKPPIVMAHGVTDDGLCWSPIAAALASDYDAIMVDARGHGRSSAPESGYDPATMADDLAELIRGLGLERPAVLGHSMGAITALAMAAAHPEVPGAILAEDPPPWWMGIPENPDPAMRDLADNIRAWIVELKQHSRDEMIAGQRSESPDWPEAELGPWAESKERFDLRGLQLFDRAVVTSMDWQTMLPRIVCPVLLITADPERGAIVNAEAAARLQELVPQTRVIHTGGAGHNIRREQPAAYLEAIRAFLPEVTG